MPRTVSKGPTRYVAKSGGPCWQCGSPLYWRAPCADHGRRDGRSTSRSAICFGAGSSTGHSRCPISKMPEPTSTASWRGWMRILEYPQFPCPRRHSPGQRRGYGADPVRHCLPYWLKERGCRSSSLRRDRDERRERRHM